MKLIPLPASSRGRNLDYRSGTTTTKLKKHEDSSAAAAWWDRKVISVRHLISGIIIGASLLSMGLIYQLMAVNVARIALSEDRAMPIMEGMTFTSSTSRLREGTDFLRRQEASTTTTATTTTDSVSQPEKTQPSGTVRKRITEIALNVGATPTSGNVSVASNNSAGLQVDPQCTRKEVEEFCSDTDNDIPICINHQVEHLQYMDIQEAHQASLHTDTDNEDSNCKTLWFAGFHEGDNACPNSNNPEAIGYAANYAVALSSALENAADALQPVLMLGRYGLSNQEASELSPIGQWAKGRGAHVIVVPKLSFQDQINVTAPNPRNQPSAAMGPFMRLDIPLIAEQHRLFDQPGICKQYVLYTDADVIFPNNVTRKEIEMLKQDLKASNDEAIVSYGRESGMHAQSFNTGVMIMDVPGFRKQWPSILEFANAQVKFPAHDQVLLNSYFSQSEELQKGRRVLSLYWNWKGYWKMQPSRHDLIKAIHFHGPKPQKGLEEMGGCDIDDWKNRILPGYQRLFKHGVCCDQGKTAKWALDLFHRFEVARDIICPRDDHEQETIPVVVSALRDDSHASSTRDIT